MSIERSANISAATSNISANAKTDIPTIYCYAPEKFITALQSAYKQHYKKDLTPYSTLLFRIMLATKFALSSSCEAFFCPENNKKLKIQHLNVRYEGKASQLQDYINKIKHDAGNKNMELERRNFRKAQKLINKKQRPATIAEQLVKERQQIKSVKCH